MRGITIPLAKSSSSLNNISVTNGLVNYVGLIERQNDFVDDNMIKKPINSSQLSYAINNKQGNQSSGAANLYTNTEP